MGFMVFGPMMDIKNLILLSGGFSRKFVLRLCLTSFVSAEWSFSWHFPPGWKGACYDKELLEQPGPG